MKRCKEVRRGVQRIQQARPDDDKDVVIVVNVVNVVSKVSLAWACDGRGDCCQ